MHTYSAAVLKGVVPPSKAKQPREGTKTREVYDLFYNNKGKPVHWCTAAGNNAAGIMAQLTDVYGLDIRRLKKNTWCLVGEWCGKVYVDYLVEK